MLCVRLLFGIGLGLSLISPVARADDPAPARIGRIAAIAGAVQYRSPMGDWSSALVNEPVASGVGVRGVRGATSVLHIAGDRVALAGASEVKFVRLDRDAVEIAVPQGRIGVHLGDAGVVATVEVDLPTGGVWLAAPGDYDISAGDAQTPPRIEVFAGKVTLGGGLSDAVFADAAPDDFDALWNTRANDAAAASPLSPTLTGGETLAASGDWSSDDTIGAVWYPKGQPTNWTPYRYGQWRFLPPWGWTWIDAADWGFAPSHYGRWVKIDERWAWVPGPRSDDPVFSPAEVAFLGTPGIGLSRPGPEGAAVGWFPLAPGETVGDDSDLRYANRRAASVVPRAVFSGGREAQTSLLDLPEGRLDDAPIIVGDLGIASTSEGATGLVAAAASALASVAHAVAAPQLTPQARARQMLLAQIHDVLAHAARKKLPPASLSSAHHWRAVATVSARPHRAPSTTATHSTHNRPHLAAARGGAQIR